MRPLPPSERADLARLVATAASLRLGDQIAVAGTPLVAAAVFGPSPGMVGAMIAAQGSAWLLVSLPAGVMIDRTDPSRALAGGFLVSMLGLAVMLAALHVGAPALFAFGAFLTAVAAVNGLLAEGATLQRVVAPERLPRANARIQLTQSLAMLAAPALMGVLVAAGEARVGYAVAFGVVLIGHVVARRVRPGPTPAPRERALRAELAEGLATVRGEPHLRAVVVCAVFWNLGFFALAAVFVPFALERLHLGADAVGFAQAAQGAGSVLAAVLAAPAIERLAPRTILIFGPAGSVAALGLMLASPLLPAWPAIAATQALLGFGPILWFVCQNTLRQLVTPPGLLGRVGAVIQVAIYGVRSLGALAGGAVATGFGLEAGLWLSFALFCASTLAVLAGPLARLERMPPPIGR